MTKEKEPNRERKSAKRGQAKRVSNRLGVFYLLILLAFVGLGVRLILITTKNNNEYQQRILSQQTYDSKTLTAKRGEIVDCNGTVLAASKEVYDVILDVKQLLSYDESNGNNLGRVTTIDTLSNVFGVDKAAINDYINNVPSSQYYVVKKQVPYEDMSRFQAFTQKPEKGKEENSLYDENVVGVWFEKHYIRYYPQSTLACDVIGFSKSEGEAAYGLEEYYNDILTGKSGRQYGYLNDDSNLEVTTIPAVDGDTLVTTIDSNIQMIVEKYIKKFSLDYKDNVRKGFGAENIGCVIMRANTAEILAMASYPDFDLNNHMDISEYYTKEEIDQMQEDNSIVDAYDSLWKNFCISDTYEPGSVMKPFTVAVGLETGTLTGNESYYCGGTYKVGDYYINCHNKNGEGTLTVKQAVEQSCNVCLMQMAESIGKKNFLEYQSIFNLGLRTNIDLAGESRTDSVVYNEKTMNETELATSSFGQGFNVTMIQMISGYAALVNGGYYYEPHLVSKILSPSGTVVKNIEPRLIKQIVSNSTSDTIKDYCNGVVTDGTGWRARPAGYRIGGKTGTAETAVRNNIDYVVSFMCHVPADDPEIICYLVIDRPNVVKQEESSYATALTKQILTEVCPYLGIPMTEEISEKEKEELMSLDLSIYTNRLDKSGTTDFTEITNTEAPQNTEDNE